MRVGVVLWSRRDRFGKVVLETLEGLGCEIVPIFPGMEGDISRVDTLLLFGPWGSLESVFRALRALPPAARPVTILWQGEQFPDPRLPQLVWWGVGLARSYLESLAHISAWRRVGPVRNLLAWLTGRLHRFRYFGDIWRYQRQGLINVLAVWSPWVGEELARRGLAPIVVGMGYYPDCGRDLGLARDIDVVCLGKAGSGRRRRLVERMRAELAQRGIALLVIGGVDHPYVFGEERTRLLNRTKIVLNLLRPKWDDNSMRFFLAAANGALVVSEPTLRHSDFTAGVHLVEAPMDRLAETVQAYLEDEQQRKAIVDRARVLAVETLTMGAALQRLLAAAESARTGSAEATGYAVRGQREGVAADAGKRGRPGSHVRSPRRARPRPEKAGGPAGIRRSPRR